MTLRPSADFGVRGHEGKPYEVNEICAVPGCGRESAHCHHIWARSELRGEPYEWVELPDGTVIGNRLGLCREHHEWVTGTLGGHKARISFESGIFWWLEKTPSGEWTHVGLLDTQPPGVQGEAVGRAPRPDEVCPTCGHTKRRKNGTPRKTKDWTLIVPDDAEIGSEVLDEWADDLATLFGFSDETSRLRRYHAVALGLAWVVQNRQKLVAEILASQR